MIYELDLDKDTTVETVMHGERLSIGTYERTYDPKNIFGKVRPQYRVFEFDGLRVLRGAGSQSDAQSLPNKRDRVFSALVDINNIISVLVVTDVIRPGYHDKTIKLVLLGNQTLQMGGRSRSQKCFYNY